MKSTLLIAFIIYFLGITTNAQEYNYYHYDIKDGLSGINVYTIAQDKDGFLWFGTETGLSRFDGSHFKNFSSEDGINENEIINLFVDSKNRVWIFPFKNSVCYYYHGKIYNASNDSLLRKFHQKSEIFSACEDKRGNIFFPELNILHVLSRNNEIEEINKIDGNSFFLNACGIGPDGNCTLFISFPGDIANYQISKYEYNSGLTARALISDHDFSRNNLEFNRNYSVIKNKDSLEIFNQRTSEYFTAKAPSHFHTISNVSDSSFAISTSQTTYLFNINQKKFVDSFLTNKTVNRCFKDNEGNLWFATIAHGLYRLSSTQFKIYNLEDGNMPVYALNRSNNNLFIGTSKMLLWNLDLKTNKLKKLKLGIEYNIGKVSTIQTDKKNLFIGSDNGVFKVTNNNIKDFYPRTSIKSMLLHNDSLLVICDRIVYDASLNNLNQPDTIWRGRVTTACEFKGKYYIGTLGSLIVMKRSKHASQDIINLGDSSFFLKDKIVATVPVSEDLWIATGNNGLVCLRDNKVIHHLTTNDGLTSNLCRCLSTSGKFLWVGTEKGICRIDLSVYPFKIIRITAAEGLDCEVINCIYAGKDSVFAGTPFGVTFFRPSKIQNNSICELKLIDIQSKNRDWYYNRDSIDLLSDDNFLQFQYAGISYISSGDITYYYQLIGLDSSWQSTKQNSIDFESLAGGSYTFNIYAVNKYGIKSKTISIAFVKEKMLWQLWWFKTMVALVIVFLISLIVQQRIKAINKSANEKILREKKIHELEQMALRAQMNPHFIFNSLNSLQQYLFAGNALEANHFISEFSSLIRQTLVISEKKFISLDEEVKYLETYLNIEQTKYEKAFDYTISIDEAIQTNNLLIPPLILQPYIENSIRHGILNLQDRKGLIQINFTVEGNSLKCIIEDNGVGRKMSLILKNTSRIIHQSKGMELVKKRIDGLNNIYHANILVLIEDLNKDNETGTRVIIKLPLNYE